MGAALDLARMIPEVKFYATKYTKFVLMELGLKEDRIVEIQPNKKLRFWTDFYFSISCFS